MVLRRGEGTARPRHTIEQNIDTRRAIGVFDDLAIEQAELRIVAALAVVENGFHRAVLSCRYYVGISTVTRLWRYWRHWQDPQPEFQAVRALENRIMYFLCRLKFDHMYIGYICRARRR